MDGSLAQMRIEHQSPATFARLGQRIHYLLYFLDLAVLLGASCIIFYAFDMNHDLDVVIRYGAAALIAALAYSLFSFSNDLHDWRYFRYHLTHPAPTFQGVVFAFGTLLLVAYVFKISSDFSRLWVAIWFASFSAYVLASRVGLAWYIRKPAVNAVLCRRAVILGAGENGRNVLDHLLRFDDQGIKVVGFLDDRSDRLPKSYRGIPLLGNTGLVEGLVRDQGIDLIIVALPWTAHERVEGLLGQLSTWAVDIYMAPDKLGLQYADRPTFRVGGMYVLSLADRPISGWNAVAKRIEDLCLAVPAVLLLSPLFALVALAIRLESKGDVFFVQDRYGFNNNLIRVYKFRSMYTDRCDVNAEKLTIKGDPRVTRVGRFIRQTSIDELPQLFNVILGDMSIVGPRPHATRAKAGDALYQDAVADYASRHRVKPGITGWAQCNGWRGETDTRDKIEKRVEHDLYYIENWSVFFDILIILKTVKMLFESDQNAY